MNKVTVIDLSVRAKEALGVIARFRGERGYAPSVREIADEMGGLSTNAVHRYLCELVEKGRIRKEKGAARSIVVL